MARSFRRLMFITSGDFVLSDLLLPRPRIVGLYLESTSSSKSSRVHSSVSTSSRSCSKRFKITNTIQWNDNCFHYCVMALPTINCTPKCCPFSWVASNDSNDNTHITDVFTFWQKVSNNQLLQTTQQFSWATETDAWGSLVIQTYLPNYH